MVWDAKQVQAWAICVLLCQKQASVRTRWGRRVSLMMENCGGSSRMVAGLEPVLAQPRSVQPSAMHTSSYSCAQQYTTIDVRMYT